MPLPFRDRRDAGRQLANHLTRYANQPDVLVLGLPRGGVPVAAEVAETLNAPLDAFLVRKLGVPGHEELAMGAIASGGIRVLNEDVVSPLAIPDAAIDAVEAMERNELARRERLYRGSQLPIDVSGRTVILVDDGLATGATMRAAAQALRQMKPARLIAAVPVGSTSVCESLLDTVDEAVCGETPDPFYAVGVWYDDFGPTSDTEVQEALQQAAERQALTEPPSQPRPARSQLASDVDVIRQAAMPILGGSDDYDGLLDLIGNARLVLIGEASHGTHEFYRERARITRRLIEERGVNAVAVEADWPDAYRVNRYVRGEGNDPDALAALGDFQRFPRWMWRNADVLDFVEWLRDYNDSRPAGAAKVGFYGLDLYSLHRSIQAVVEYLSHVDPEGAERARARYACFDHFGDDPQVYGYATTLGLAESCENEVVGQLLELQQRAAELARHNGLVDPNELFFVEQNARLAKNAEAYYRAMFYGRIPSWNLRDRHMAETLTALVDHLGQGNGSARVAVWAHNSHVGDARATAMAAEGELNLGQLVRERYERDAMLVGLTTYTGTVTAARDWDEPAEQRHVRPALSGSYEALFHQAGQGRDPDFWLRLRDAGAELDPLRQSRLQRAIGVIYRPETERFSHYFPAKLADQFDAILHFDETTAVEPLDRGAGWETPEELPETFPFAV